MIQPYVVILKLNLYILLRDIEELQYHRYELHDFGKVYLCVHNICYVYIKFLRTIGSVDTIILTKTERFAPSVPPFEK